MVRRHEDAYFHKCPNSSNVYIPMSQAKYSVNQHPISIGLAWIAQGEIAIPEIQRPFVWSATVTQTGSFALRKNRKILAHPSAANIVDNS